MLERLTKLCTFSTQLDLDEDIIDAAKKVIIQSENRKQQEQQENNDKTNELIVSFSDKIATLEEKMDNGLNKLEDIFKVVVRDKLTATRKRSLEGIPSNK